MNNKTLEKARKLRDRIIVLDHIREAFWNVLNSAEDLHVTSIGSSTVSIKSDSAVYIPIKDCLQKEYTRISEEIDELESQFEAL